MLDTAIVNKRFDGNKMLDIMMFLKEYTQNSLYFSTHSITLVALTLCFLSWHFKILGFLNIKMP